MGASGQVGGSGHVGGSGQVAGGRVVTGSVVGQGSGIHVQHNYTNHYRHDNTFLHWKELQFFICKVNLIALERYVLLCPEIES